MLGPSRCCSRVLVCWGTLQCPLSPPDGGCASGGLELVGVTGSGTCPGGPYRITSLLNHLWGWFHPLPSGWPWVTPFFHFITSLGCFLAWPGLPGRQGYCAHHCALGRGGMVVVGGPRGMDGRPGSRLSVFGGVHRRRLQVESGALAPHQRFKQFWSQFLCRYFGAETSGFGARQRGVSNPSLCPSCRGSSLMVRLGLSLFSSGALGIFSAVVR